MDLNDIENFLTEDKTGANTTNGGIMPTNHTQDSIRGDSPMK